MDVLPNILNCEVQPRAAGIGQQVELATSVLRVAIIRGFGLLIKQVIEYLRGSKSSALPRRTSTSTNRAGIGMKDTHVISRMPPNIRRPLFNTITSQRQGFDPPIWERLAQSVQHGVMANRLVKLPA